MICHCQPEPGFGPCTCAKNCAQCRTGSKLEIQTGEPSTEGRYVVWTPCAALSARQWCEPSIATWQGGKWHSYEPVWGWIGPLPVVHGNDCLNKMREYDL